MNNLTKNISLFTLTFLYLVTNSSIFSAAIETCGHSISQESSEQTRKCNYCKKSSTSLTICSGCEKAHYCSKECQTSDRVKHKKKCQPFGGLIAEALMGQMVITTAYDPKPIVATDTCGPCIAVGGYDATNEFAFVIHFTDPSELRTSGDKILSEINKHIKVQPQSPIKVYLHGGILNDADAEQTRTAIKKWLNDLPISTKIVSEKATQDTHECFLPNYKGQSLLIDSQTGNIMEYNHKLNPYSPELQPDDQSEEDESETYEISVVYTTTQ